MKENIRKGEKYCRKKTRYLAKYRKGKWEKYIEWKRKEKEVKNKRKYSRIHRSSKRKKKENNKEKSREKEKNFKGK